MKMRYSALILLAFLWLTGCNKEKRYVYEVQPQELYQNAAQKQYLKTTDQFISIAYTHLFNASITNNELNKINVALLAVGDKATIQDMIVKNMIKDVQTISNNDMRADLPAFVDQTYLRFFNRKPNEFEAWKLKDLVEKNADITPKMVYYSMMTSNEYRYY
ncbi:MAG TPA: hypothetical protein VK174_01100 [Chitinophagales bacterium]|nr:hypothetical protein [Chitinophagales bacterium]HLP53127.1 hypothetical protein [Chitinophagales bacterium]